MILSVQHYQGDGSEWDAFVASRPDGANYHRYGWREVLEKSFGHKTYYLAARNQENEIRGVLPYVHVKSVLFGSFLVSLPYFNYGGLLCADDDAVALLLNRSRNMLWETGASFVELRHLVNCGQGLATRQHKVSMILDLQEDEEEQWRVLDAKVRNQVRKAQKSGLGLVLGQRELLDDFYAVFCRNMRDLGTPVYGKEFFGNILDAFPDSTHVLAVRLGDRTIAAGIATLFRGTLEVPWAASVRDFRDLCPNNLLYWEAIRFAIGKKAARFDFGRSTPGEGTYRFKKQWGARPVQLYWQYLLGNGVGMPNINPSNPKFDLAVKVWRRLPLALTRVLGPPIVRCIP